MTGNRSRDEALPVNRSRDEALPGNRSQDEALPGNRSRDEARGQSLRCSTAFFCSSRSSISSRFRKRSLRRCSSGCTSRCVATKNVSHSTAVRPRASAYQVFKYSMLAPLHVRLCSSLDGASAYRLCSSLVGTSAYLAFRDSGIEPLHSAFC